MTDREIDSFYHCLSEHYRKRRNEADDKFAQLFEITIDILREVGDSSLDGSGITHLKEYILARHESLRQIIGA